MGAESGLILTVWAGVTAVRVPHVTDGPAPRGERGPITELSRSARRRLIRTLAEARRDPKLWVTLTYGDTFPSPRDSKADLARWCRWLTDRARELGGELATVWRLESQGRGAPHFHCLLYSDIEVTWANMLPPAGPIRQLAERFNAERGWSSPAGSGSQEQWRGVLALLSAAWCHAMRDHRSAVLHRSVDVEELSRIEAVTRYVAKYVSKGEKDGEPREQGADWRNAGRRWGIRGPDSALCRMPLAVGLWSGAIDDGRDEATFWRDVGCEYGAKAAERGSTAYWCLAEGDAVRNALRSRGVRMTDIDSETGLPQTDGTQEAIDSSAAA